MAMPVSIAKLTHRVKLCTEGDVRSEGGLPILERLDAMTVWAQILPKRGSFFVNGVAAMENRENPSHIVTIRFRPDVDIRSTAWIFEERRLAPPRWYKVLSVVDRGEDGRWCDLEVRLVQSDADLVKPAPVEAEPSVFKPVVGGRGF